jgi:tRNA pseudouridine38-40 synthase
VRSTFHARHSTTAKTYEYRVFLERRGRLGCQAEQAVVCPPFLARYVFAYPWPLDVEALQESASAFVGTHDFVSFAATDPDSTSIGRESDPECDEEDAGSPDAIRTIFGSGWRRQAVTEGALLVYHVRGSGFLHHMVRNLVGTMLDVGRGYRRVDEIPAMIAARSRAAAGPTAPARGLFLHSVEYPPESER